MDWRVRKELVGNWVNCVLSDVMTKTEVRCIKQILPPAGQDLIRDSDDRLRLLARHIMMLLGKESSRSKHLNAVTMIYNTPACPSNFILKCGFFFQPPKLSSLGSRNKHQTYDVTFRTLSPLYPGLETGYLVNFYFLIV